MEVVSSHPFYLNIYVQVFGNSAIGLFVRCEIGHAKSCHLTLIPPSSSDFEHLGGISSADYIYYSKQHVSNYAASIRPYSMGMLRSLLIIKIIKVINAHKYSC